MSLSQATSPTAHPTKPQAILPPGACDTHVHMMASDFPLSDKRGEDPAPGTFEDWAVRLETHLDTFGLDRVVLVHAIMFGLDNAVTLAAVKRMGERARGIALISDDISETDLDAFAAGGVRGVRLNLINGGALSWDGVQAMAPRLAARDMHVQILLNADRHMTDLAAGVRALPVPVVVDHVGWPDVGAGPDEPGFETLRQLVADGAAHVKLSAFNRFCDVPYDAVAGHVAALAQANPEGCVWASDWPHIALGGADQPDTGALLNTFLDVVTNAATQETIFCRVPEKLYGF